MFKNTIKLFTLLILLFSITINAQKVSSKLIDSISKEPIPYANIIFKKGGTISNEEGKFTFLFGKNAKPTDTLMISCIGYETIKRPLTHFTDSVILMAPKTNELREVILTNKNYTAKEIIAKVRENIMQNYNFDD